jgi:hypothetical protein
MGELKRYAIPYHHNGRLYTIEVFAEDPWGARQRLRSALYQGNEPEEIVAQVEAPKWFSKLIGG